MIDQIIEKLNEQIITSISLLSNGRTTQTEEEPPSIPYQLSVNSTHLVDADRFLMASMMEALADALSEELLAETFLRIINEAYRLATPVVSDKSIKDTIDSIYRQESDLTMVNTPMATTILLTVMPHDLDRDLTATGWYNGTFKTKPMFMNRYADNGTILILTDGWLTAEYNNGTQSISTNGTSTFHSDFRFVFDAAKIKIYDLDPEKMFM